MEYGLVFSNFLVFIPMIILSVIHLIKEYKDAFSKDISWRKRFRKMNPNWKLAFILCVFSIVGLILNLSYLMTIFYR